MATTKAAVEAVGKLPTSGMTTFHPQPPDPNQDSREFIGAGGTEVKESGPTPDYDQFTVTQQERQAFGIEDNRALAWIRNPKIWEPHEKKDRFREFRHQHPGAKIAEEDGDFVTQGDLLLVHYPIEQKEKEEAVRTAGYNRFVNGDPDAEEKAFTRDRAKEMAARMRQQNVRESMTGPNSPTSGQSLEDVYARKTEKEILAEEARYRRGPRQSSFDSNDWANLIDEGRPNKGKAYGMGESGFPRNPKSPAAQAAARERRA